MNDQLLVVKHSALAEAALVAQPPWLHHVPWITSLGHCVQVKVYIPTISRKGRRLPCRSVRSAIERVLLRLANGGNFSSGRGVWRSWSGNVIREPVGVGDAYVPVAVPPRALSNFLVSLRMLAVEWEQEAILAVVGDWGLLISGKTFPNTEETGIELPPSEANGAGGDQ